MPSPANVSFPEISPDRRDRPLLAASGPSSNGVSSLELSHATHAEPVGATFASHLLVLNGSDAIESEWPADPVVAPGRAALHRVAAG